MLLMHKKEVLAMAIANTILFGSVDASFLSGRKRKPEQQERLHHPDVTVVADGAPRGFDKDKSRDDRGTNGATNLRVAPHHDTAVAHASSKEDGRAAMMIPTLKKDARATPAAASDQQHDSGVLADSPWQPPLKLENGSPQEGDTITSREIKASKSSKTPESSKTSKSTKNPKTGGAPEPVACFTGTGAEVMAACMDADASCCCSDGNCEYSYFNEGTNFPPCEWESSTVTVCSGSCNGGGACYDAGNDLFADGAIIEEDSCNDNYACRGIISSIKKNSCNGMYSCSLLTYGYIKEDSCNGNRACFFSEGNGIGKNSCNGDIACFFSYGDIDEGSCNADEACYGTSDDIGPNQCNTANACSA